MATVLADPPAPDAEQTPPGGPDGGASGEQGTDAKAASQRNCKNCGKPMDAGQDWCLQCGAAAPGALGTRSPGWRSAALILGATAILVLAAAAAAYAALTEPGKSSQQTQTIAQVPAPTTVTTPAAPVTPPATASTPPAPPTTATPVPGTTTKPPKIPLTATPTPKAAPAPAKTPATTTKPAPAPTKTSGTSTEPAPKQQPILLDTDAASTYNPNHLPESSFGDPSLAVDGDTSTGWTAQVEPATAPNMTVGLLVDLRNTQRLSSIALVTATPGLTLQVYGSSAETAPASITEPGWVALSASEVVKKRHSSIKLRDSGTGFRFVTLWITKAPASAVGTPQAPGRVSINELELFAAK